MVMAPLSDGSLRPTDQSLNQLSLEYGYSELTRATNNWNQKKNLLGTGSYGAVYRGVMDDGTEVAIKTLDLPDEGGFTEEVKVLSRFRHPNLVILMGLARHKTQRILVYELLAGGDTHRRLQLSQNNTLPFPWHQRLSVALDAACGLSHLHNASPKVFHRDIKCPNILIDSNGTAKMADFGLACLDTLGDKYGFRVKQASGTVGYACPIYIQTGVITEGSEVYSFGMVLLELLTANPPAVQQEDGSFAYLAHHLRDDVFRAVALVDPKAHWPQGVDQTVAELAIRCISVNEESRIRFRDIVQRLRAIKNSNHPRAPEQTFTPVVTPKAMPLPSMESPKYPCPSPKAQTPSVPHAQISQPKKELFIQRQTIGLAFSKSSRRKSPRRAGILPMQMFNIVKPTIPGASAPIRRERTEAKADINVRQSSGMATSSGSGAGRPALGTTKPTLFALEVVYCEDADLTTFSHHSRCLRHDLEEYVSSGPFPPFRIGRLFFQSLFEALLPDPNMRSVISREHFQVWIDDSFAGINSPAGEFFLTNFSGNGVKVRDAFIANRGAQIAVRDGDLISILKNPVDVDSQKSTAESDPLIQFRFDTTGSVITEIPTSLPSVDDEKDAPLYELVFGGPGVAQVTLQDRVVTFRPPKNQTSKYSSLVIGKRHQRSGDLSRILLPAAYQPIANTLFEIQAWRPQPQEADAKQSDCTSTHYTYTIRGLALEFREFVGFCSGSSSTTSDVVSFIEHAELRRICHQDRILLNQNSEENRVTISFFDLSDGRK